MRRALDQRAFEALLRLSPRRFRTRFGDELAAQHAARARRSGPPAVLRRGQWRAVRDLLRQLPSLWRDELAQRRAGARPPRPRRGDGTVRMLFDEVLHAARRLRRSGRLLTALSMGTLGLGVGAAVAMVTVVRGVLIAPLPYGEPDRIVRIFKDSADEGDFFLPGVRFAAAREQLGSLEQIAGFYDYQEEGLDLVREGRGRRLRTLRVSAGYFEALGVAPLLGRTFERREEIPDGAGQRDPNRFEMVTAPAQPVAILSWRLWNDELGGDPGVLGSRLELGGSRFSAWSA